MCRSFGFDRPARFFLLDKKFCRLFCGCIRIRMEFEKRVVSGVLWWGGRRVGIFCDEEIQNLYMHYLFESCPVRSGSMCVYIYVIDFKSTNSIEYRSYIYIYIRIYLCITWLRVEVCVCLCVFC